jgi:hypothetical protein
VGWRSGGGGDELGSLIRRRLHVNRRE